MPTPEEFHNDLEIIEIVVTDESTCAPLGQARAQGPHGHTSFTRRTSSKPSLVRPS